MGPYLEAAEKAGVYSLLSNSHVNIRSNILCTCCFKRFGDQRFKSYCHNHIALGVRHINKMCARHCRSTNWSQNFFY